jgi:protein-S-isoprenylcysteine O-methyltransferase Ste14
MLIVKGLVGGLVQVALFAVFLLVPAGTWDWPRAIQFLVTYGVLVSVSTIVLAVVAPASLEARLVAPTAKSQPLEDRVASAFLFASIFGFMAFIPIDVFHLRLFPRPTFGVSVFGATLLLAGFGIMVVTLYQNAFAAAIVKDQADRGQVVIDSGLYSRVRHPFYVGVVLFFIGLALWLESYAGVLAVSLVFASLVARIHAEEKALRNTLPGYTEYMNKVRYRLVPGFW